MRSLLRFLFAFLTVGGTVAGCAKPDTSAPATPTDVTLSVPAMN